MMDKLTGSKKRITAALIAIVLTFAAVAGIAAAVRATTASTVAVIPVSDLNYGNYLDWQNNVTGKITTEAEQNIYLSDTEKVQEVAVQEGQVVRKGDVLLRYDTESTRLSLEKEKVKREKIELDIEVAKENIKTLENASADSDGGDFGLIGDFIETDPAEVLAKASVHEKVLRADAKPVSEGSEYEILGTEFAPYVFLCKGDSVIMTKDFIKKWQKEAEKLQFKQLYIELAVLDESQKLQKAWIQDIMLLDPNYDIEVDLRTGKTSYAAMNDPEQMAALLRKILLDVPENERGAWLAAMFDKLMVLTEKEEEQTERGALFAAMLNELGKEEQADFAAEFAAAASLLDDKTLSFMPLCWTIRHFLLCLRALRKTLNRSRSKRSIRPSYVTFLACSVRNSSKCCWGRERKRSEPFWKRLSRRNRSLWTEAVRRAETAQGRQAVPETEKAPRQMKGLKTTRKLQERRTLRACRMKAVMSRKKLIRNPPGNLKRRLRKNLRSPRRNL